MQKKTNKQTNKQKKTPNLDFAKWINFSSSEMTYLFKASNFALYF